MDCVGLLELQTPPVRFDPPGGPTLVFFDDRNRQILSVRSGGATGIVVKGAGEDAVSSPRTFVLPEDRGLILSIKLSPDQKVLSLQRETESNVIVFYNILTPAHTNTPELDSQFYDVVTRSKAGPTRGFFWTSDEEIVILSEGGIDIYSIHPQKKILKYVRGSSVTISWYVYSQESNLLVTAPKKETNILQVWSLRGGTAYKLAGVELGGTGGGGRSLVREGGAEASVIVLYGLNFLRVNIVEEGKTHQINLYLVENDQVVLSRVLTVGRHGPARINIIDNLLIVHCIQDCKTLIYDIGTAGSLNLDTGVTTHCPVLPACGLVDAATRRLVPYQPAWAAFQPGIVVDARVGNMWTLGLNIDKAGGEDPVVLCEFLLNREGGKAPLISLLRDSLLDSAVPLPKISKMLYSVVLAYHRHQTQGEVQIPLGTGFDGPLASANQNAWMPPPVVALDQSDLSVGVLAAAEKGGVALARLKAVLVELLLALHSLHLPPKQFIIEIFITVCIKLDQHYQLHQYVQYGIVPDTKHLACIFLSLQGSYPPARQIALDMLSRLGTAAEEIIEICLSEGKVIEALNIAVSTGLIHQIPSQKFLARAGDKDGVEYYNVYSFFESRGQDLTSTAEDNRGPYYYTLQRRLSEVMLGSNSLSSGSGLRAEASPAATTPK